VYTYQNPAFLTKSEVYRLIFSNRDKLTLGIFKHFDIKTIGVITIVSVALILNITTFLVFHRSKLHLKARLNRCYYLEDKLNNMGIEFQTLSSCE
jgi:hypothetical protein